MYDLDHALRRLADHPAPSALATIDDTVLAELATRRRETAAGSRLTGFAAALALLVGMVSGSLTGGEAAVAEPASPFAINNPLAPSTLLDVHS